MAGPWGTLGQETKERVTCYAFIPPTLTLPHQWGGKKLWPLTQYTRGEEE